MAELRKTSPICFHFRNRDQQGHVLGKGGLTIVFNPVTSLFGIAKCNPTIDNFSRRMGRIIAGARSEPPSRNKTGRPCVNVPFHSKKLSGMTTFDDVKIQAFLIATEFGFKKTKITN